MKVILDNGHGGMINGVYQTPGKRSPQWEKGVLYEGMFNRWVVNRLIEKMDREQISYYHVSPELEDVTLQKRVLRINDIFSKDKDVYVLSIHANAGGGYGIEGFTSKGGTKSDFVSETFLQQFNQSTFENLKIRTDYSDGDMDKEQNFFILRKTHCAAFLFECGFMDNRKDYENLWNEEYLEMILSTLFEAIKKLYYEN